MDLRSLIDDALEITVVGSFTKVGPLIRRRLFDWRPPASDALVERTILITGPTSGLGRAATDAMAALGARIVLVGRSEARLTALRDDLVRRHGEDRYPMVVADMGSLTSVRAAVERVLTTETRLDVMVDNAGAIFPARTMSPDGIESTLATLVVGPFAMTRGLLPLLERTPGSRVISVTSGGMYTQQLDVHDLQYAAGTYNGSLAYARAKRAQVALMREWARRRPWLGSHLRGDAPRVGGHARPCGVAAVVLPGHGSPVAQPCARRGDRRMAGSAGRRDAVERQAAPGPPSSPVRPDPVHTNDGSATTGALGRGHRPLDGATTRLTHCHDVLMTVYADYTPDEQRLLIQAIAAAAIVVSAASPGSKADTVARDSRQPATCWIAWVRTSATPS